jgi:hypothetical protein
LGTQLNISTAFHPQTDGQTERTNRQLEQVLRHYVNAQHDNWDELLAVAEFTINNHVSATTGYSPFFLDTGMQPRVPLSMVAQRLAAGTEEVPLTTQSFVEEWRAAEDSARVAMRLAQQRYAAQADLHRRDHSHQPGDKVLLSTEHLVLRNQPSSKFKQRWLGPYSIRRVISPVAYELLLPRTLKIHPVFHISLLKPYVEDTIHPPPPAPPDPVMNEAGEEEYYVEEILKHRVRRVGRNQRLEFLVRWTGYGPDADEYLPLADVQETVAYDRYEQEMRRKYGATWPAGLVSESPPPRRVAR